MLLCWTRINNDKRAFKIGLAVLVHKRKCPTKSVVTPTNIYLTPGSPCTLSPKNEKKIINVFKENLLL